MRCPKFRNYDVSRGTKPRRGVKSRVKKLSVTKDQSSIFFLEVYPIPFLGLDLIEPRSSLFCSQDEFPNHESYDEHVCESQQLPGPLHQLPGVASLGCIAVAEQV